MEEASPTAAALRRSEAQFRQIIDVSPVPYALNDERQNITYLNPAFVRTFGYTLADIPTLADWWPRAYPEPEYRRWAAETWAARLDQARSSGAPFEPVEVRIRCKDGTERTVLVGAASLGDDFAGLHLVILYDITERKRAEEQRRELEERARQAQKLESLGMLAGGIAHDFNNMLQGILGNAELALKDLPQGSRTRSAIEEVASIARSCAGLTSQMLAYAGKGRVAIDDVSLTWLIEDMRGLLQASVPKKTTLELDLPKEIRAVSGDASQLRQVVLNLVINAGEAIGDRPGKIAVRVSQGRCETTCPCRTLYPSSREWPARDVVALVVADTGDGMDEVTRARMFDPFFSTKFSGRGLGLAAVHGILRGHRAGAIVESGRGQGTTFTVHFPAEDRLAAHATASAPEPSDWRGRGTVLFAEDEPAIQRFARAVLEDLGFTVLSARDGAAAVELFRAHKPAIVCAVLDLAMPGLDGAETLAGLRALRPDLPVIVTSGYGEERVEDRLRGNGPYLFLQKPYELVRLVASLRQLLE
jgi:PAS domain S-box-containing protein